MTLRPTQKVAIAIVRAYLADMGGPEAGFDYGREESRLRRAIERAILDDRKAQENVRRVALGLRARAQGEGR